MKSFLFAVGLLSVSCAALCSAPVPTTPPDATKDRDGNPLPKGATARLGFGGLRARKVFGVSFTPDSKFVSTANDRDVFSWDCETGRALPVKSFAPADSKLHAGNICIAGDRVFMLGFRPFAPGMVGMPEPRIVVLDRETGREVTQIQYTGSLNFTPNFAPYYIPERLPSAAPSADGRFLALVSAPDKTIGVYDTGTAKRLCAVKVEHPTETGCLIAPDGKALYVTDSRGAVRRFELPSGKALPDLDGTDKFTNMLAASPDGKWAVARGQHLVRDAKGEVRSIESDEFLTVCDPVANKALGKLELSGRADVFAFAGSGAVIAVAARYRPPGPPVFTMSRWNIETRKHDWEVSVPQSVQRIAVSPDGKRVALFVRNEVFELYDALTGKRTTPAPRHSGWVGWIGFAPDGQTVTTVGGSEAILWTLKGEAKSTTAISEVARGNMQPWLLGDRLAWPAYATDGKTATLVGWDAEKNAIGCRMPLDGAGPERVYSHDGRRVVGAFVDEKTKKTTIVVFDGPTGKRLHEWELPSGEWNGPHALPPLALSGDGKVLFVGGASGVVGCDVTSGKELVTVGTGALPKVTMRIAHPLAVSPDGKRLAVVRTNFALKEQTLEVFDVKTGKRLGTHEVGNMLYPALKFSPDGGRIAVHSMQGVTVVCETVSDAKPLKLDAGAAQVWCTVFSANGATLAVGYGDGTTLLWDLTAK